MPAGPFAAAADNARCVTCHERIEGADWDTCSACGGRFHLALTRTSATPDCGTVQINAEWQALQFLCQPCLDRVSGAAPQPSAPALPPAASAVPGVWTRHRGLRARDLLSRRASGSQHPRASGSQHPRASGSQHPRANGAQRPRRV